MAMTIRKEDPYPDEWELAGRSQDTPGEGPLFAECHAYQVLRRELRRYAANELRGRSFLVAGHRGSGKTTLVLRAIAAVREENKSRAVGQRPLLVKLHGPSLLMKVATPNGPPVQKEPETKTKAAAGDKAKDPAPESGKTIKGPQPADGDGSAHATLVQITIALYRALTEEVVSCYHRFAVERAADGGAADFPELVGQLSLELDNAPGPAVLRDFWSRVGALRPGLLWRAAGSEEDHPRASRPARGPLLREVAGLGRGYEDQGIREIVAICTAAQAFQVVSGCIEYKTAQKGCVKEDAARKVEINPVKDILYPLLGVLTGGLVGGGTAMTWKPGEAPVSVGLGLAAALGTFLILSWMGARRGDRRPEEDHAFIRDHSVATLGRELPIVIERIRRAGLAPVFVVDELDKVDDLSHRMTELVEQLKHIVADYSFFCFLADRKYLESLRDRSQYAGYPKQYTYFSHRLFLLYRPNDLHEYLTRLIDIEPCGSPPEQTREEIGRLALSYLLLHRAMLHTFDLQRQLTGVCDDQGHVIVTTDELLNYLGYRFHIMIQLAVESLLGESQQKDRLNQDPQFGQFIYDALYLPSRNWLSGAFELDLSDEAVEYYLRTRLEETSEPAPVPKHKGEQEPAQGQATTAASGVSGTSGKKGKSRPKAREETPAPEPLPPITSLVRETDRQYLIGLAQRLVDLLTKPKDLFARLLQEESPAWKTKGSETHESKEKEADQWAKLVGTIPGIGENCELPLLEVVDAETHRYRWCRDPFGRKLHQQVVREAPLPQQQEDDDRFIGHMEKFLADLGGADLSPDRLADRGIFWSYPDWQGVQKARQRLSEFRSGRRPTDKNLLSDQDLVHEYVGKLASRGQLLAGVLIAGRLLGHKSGRSGAREQTVHGVQALSKVISFAPPLQEMKTLNQINRLVSRYKSKALRNVPALTRENLDKWKESVTKAHAQAGESPLDGDLLGCRERAWHAWAGRVDEFAKTGRSSPEPHLDEALCIAGDGPAALALVKHVEHLSLYEASTVLWAALADMRSGSPRSTPFSAGFPALYLLGMPPDAIDLFAHLPLMIPGSRPFPAGRIMNGEVPRWRALAGAGGEERRRSCAFIWSEGADGVTSQWPPAPSFGAVVAPEERLVEALHYEVFLRSVCEAVQSQVNFAVVFLEIESIDPERLACAERQIPTPLSKLPRFILSREPSQQTPPPPWRVLRQTQCLEEAMKEALEIIGPDRMQSDRPS